MSFLSSVQLHSGPGHSGQVWLQSGPYHPIMHKHPSGNAQSPLTHAGSHIGVSQFTFVHPSEHLQVSGKVQFPCLQSEQNGTEQSDHSQPIAHVHTFGKVHVPPFKHPCGHCGVVQSPPSNP